MVHRPRLLDLTRLLSRAGRGHTGVDRVERAYLDRFLADAEVPLFGLIRTGQGQLLFDRAGLEALRQRIVSGDWGQPRGLSRLSRRLSPVRRDALSRARELAVARSLRPGLGRMLSRLGGPFDYYNVGHAHLDAASLAAIGGAGGTRHVLLHDTIPLDHPDLTRPEAVASFRARFGSALAGADRIIVNSRATAEAVRRHAGAGPCPPITVAPLGLDLPKTLGAPGLCDGRPYFVALGTIEPRKNHALLLDAWERLGPTPPALLIIGARGWRNEAVFNRLDGLPPDGPVQELGALDDATALGLVAGARALLFPSLAEGYGLPPLEAAALGTPAIVSDLPVLRETLGESGVYLDPADVYSWVKEIERLAASPPPERTPMPNPPSWAAHFGLVLDPGGPGPEQQD